jgi:hypothetical protein
MNTRFNIVEMNGNDSNLPQNLFEQLRLRKIDAFILRKALPKETTNIVANIILNYKGKGMVYHSTGSMFPRQFSSVSNEAELPALKESWAYFGEELAKLDFNLLDWQKRLFQKLNRKSTLKDVKSEKADFSWGWGTLRNCPAKQGGMWAYCGNLFEKEYPFFHRLVNGINTLNQLSYFMVMQEPEEGGELALYDLEYKQADKRLLIKAGTALPIGIDKKPIDMQQIAKHNLKLNTGDMLFFAGGQIWHRVNPVGGSKDRITYGGFIGYDSQDEKSYYVWS